MNLEIVTKWLMILAISTLKVQCILATSQEEFKLEDVVAINFFTQFLPEITAVEKEYTQMTYLIQEGFPDSSPTSSNNVPTYDSVLVKPNSSIPLKPLKLCIISKEELEEISTIVENNGEEDNPLIIIQHSNNCSELDRIKFGILKLKNDFNQLIKNQISSVRYVELKVSYQTKLKSVLKEMDDAIKNASADDTEMISKLRRDLQSQEVRINSIMNQLEEKQKHLNEVSIRLCVSYLLQNQIDAALETYGAVSDKSRMMDIIASAYGNGDKFYKLLDFIDRTGDPISSLNGYAKLFEKMKSNNNMSGLKMLFLTNGAEKNKDPAFNKLISSLEDVLIVMHRNNDFADFYSYVYRKTDNKSFEFGNEIMPIFVRTAYNNNPSNVKKILSLRSQFYYMRHRLFLIVSLISVMKNQSHTNQPEFTMVISKAIDIKAEVYKQMDEADKKYVEEMYRNIPESVRALLYPNLCIQNAMNNEFLHSEISAADDVRRHIYTSITNKFDNMYSFEVKFLDGGKIHIKNIHYNEHLFLMDMAKSPRRLMSWIKTHSDEDELAYFVIEAVDAKYVRIKSVKFNEYLYSPYSNEKFEDNERGVYAARQVSNNGLWRLSTCRL